MTQKASTLFAPNRRRALYGLAATLVVGAAPAQAADFAEFIEGLWPSAQVAGVSRATFDAAVSGLAPEPGVLSKPKAQAEFTISIPAYLASTVTNSRVARGQSTAAALAGPLGRATARHGVPGEIIVAILGVESNFGVATGGADVLAVLATLAWKGHRAETFIGEFVDALVMLEKGYATRGQLRGSWAGAMGQPQFMPSAYLKFAESDDGAGAPDIWRSHADAVASIANFLAKSGWVAGLPAVLEIRLPDGFDYAAFDLDLARWRALGVARADGGALPASGAASLYLPAGASGPAFLITDNFEVIRQYNTSDAYAMSVAVLAERIAGRDIPLAPWPRVAPLSTADVKAMQQLLTQKGYYQGTIDGKLGRTSRNAIHAFQLAEGIQPADGFATKAVLAQLRR
ncbi:lytic murein transglycosylase [Methylocystis echinoides]|uniref:Lytic transglycosylase n=1 Tax=Methylocystis echinoides TaxID=29468 RepID=A0A9W6GPM8_9HYPH|nr:lytic murein transglycosylase [Methylocystis echinoides]GLI91052.1 lytic transglycosylase [Methylocystis echinoides]